MNKTIQNTNDFFFGMTEAEIKDYQESEERIEQDRINQYAKDTELIRTIKKQVPKKLFKQIVAEIYESENWTNLRIVNKPTGKQQSVGGRNNVWVDQYVGYCGDDYSGYCYIKLPNGKYLAWDYWC